MNFDLETTTVFAQTIRNRLQRSIIRSPRIMRCGLYYDNTTEKTILLFTDYKSHRLKQRHELYLLYDHKFNQYNLNTFDNDIVLFAVNLSRYIL